MFYTLRIEYNVEDSRACWLSNTMLASQYSARCNTCWWCNTILMVPYKGDDCMASPLHCTIRIVLQYQMHQHCIRITSSGLRYHIASSALYCSISSMSTEFQCWCFIQYNADAIPCWWYNAEMLMRYHTDDTSAMSATMTIQYNEDGILLCGRWQQPASVHSCLLVLMAHYLNVRL